MTKINPTALEIPRFVSSFELEEARLGQAIQKVLIEHQESLEPELIKKTLRKIKNESINAEFALDFVSKEFIADLEAKEDPASLKRAREAHEIISWLLHVLLKK